MIETLKLDHYTLKVHGHIPCRVEIYMLMDSNYPQKPLQFINLNKNSVKLHIEYRRNHININQRKVQIFRNTIEMDINEQKCMVMKENAYMRNTASILNIRIQKEKLKAGKFILKV